MTRPPARPDSHRFNALWARVREQLARDKVRREEFTLDLIPRWRIFQRARQRTVLLDAQVAHVAAMNATQEAVRALRESEGAA